MRLKQYFDVLELLKTDKTLDEISAETDVPLVQIMDIKAGAKPADYILFQYTGTETRCPVCHSITTLPCLFCFYKEHPDIETVDVIKRPLRNMDRVCEIMLDVDLLDEGGDDEEEENYEDSDLSGDL